MKRIFALAVKTLIRELPHEEIEPYAKGLFLIFVVRIGMLLIIGSVLLLASSENPIVVTIAVISVIALYSGLEVKVMRRKFGIANAAVMYERFHEARDKALEPVQKVIDKEKEVIDLYEKELSNQVPTLTKAELTDLAKTLVKLGVSKLGPFEEVEPR